MLPGNGHICIGNCRVFGKGVPIPGSFSGELIRYGGSVGLRDSGCLGANGIIRQASSAAVPGRTPDSFSIGFLPIPRSA